jgi:Fic family protein
MNFKLEQEFSKADILKQVDELKNQIDALRPLPPDVEGRVMQKLRLDWNYHSNAIEGNRLSYGETIAFLMEGITAKGKPLKDHLDIRGHNEAINFLLSIVKDTRPVTEADIRALHKMTLVEEYDVKASTADGLPTTKRITLGEYKTSPNHVKTATGEIHYYAKPEETPAKMQELMEWYIEAIEQSDIHPLVTAALFHHKFVSIHPFDDGNGRLSRILMNLILMQRGYPPVVIKIEDRTNYYSLLSRADNGDEWPFVEYIAENMVGSLNLYLKAAKGGDINDDDDIDKDVALFRMQIRDFVTAKEKKSKSIIRDIIQREFSPLINKIFITVNQFAEDFLDHRNYIRFKFDNDFRYSDVKIIDLDILDTVIGDNFNNCTGIEFFLDFLKFKNADNAFSISCIGYIDFDEFKFTVVGNERRLILSKQYQQSMTDLEKRKIIKWFVEDVKNLISQHLKK